MITLGRVYVAAASERRVLAVIRGGFSYAALSAVRAADPMRAGVGP